MHANGLSCKTTLYDYVLVANYTAEILLLISGLNYLEEHSGRELSKKSQSYTETIKIFVLARWVIIHHE